MNAPSSVRTISLLLTTMIRLAPSMITLRVLVDQIMVSCRRALTRQINEFNVLCAINRMKSGFSSGPDGLPPVFFKRLQYTVAKPLSIIFHQLLSVAYVPDDWKKALITPVYKRDLKLIAPIIDLSPSHVSPPKFLSESYAVKCVSIL